jgi:hypothetical protein
MAKAWKGEERRSHPRIPTEGQVQGKLQTAIEAPVLDLSQSGALLEVPFTLPASSRYVLKLAVDNGPDVELTGEIVRCYVHGFDKDERGQPSVRYRAAVKFVELERGQDEALKAFLAREGGTGGLRVELSN